MPLLNPPDILPEAMRFLVRALVALPGQRSGREELIDLVAPAGLAEAMASVESPEESNAGDDAEVRSTGQHVAACSLDALTTLALVHEDGDGVALAEDVRQLRRPHDVEAWMFAGLLLERVTGAGQGRRDPDRRRVGDLFHALEMLHAAADPLRPFDTFGGKGGRRRFVDWQTEKLGPDQSGWPVRNQERWLPLRRWAAYLGVGRAVGGGLVADASTALQRSLGALAQGDYPIDDFVQRCVAALPFLDASGSPFGHDSEGELGVLSPGMSLTFRVLQANGFLTLYSKSDTGGRIMRIRADRSLDDRVTHVSWAVPSPRRGAARG